MSEPVNLKNLAGQRFGRLVVVCRTPTPPMTRNRYAYWSALCDCGETTVVRSSHLLSGTTSSCGCLRIEAIKAANTRHGLTKTRTWKAWSSMLERCYLSSSDSYSNYGGRGITVCERWRQFEAFLEDMGEAPSGMSLDRKDNNGNYEPGNCRWATASMQARNRRSTIVVCMNGRTAPLADLADERGLPPVIVAQRIRRGWTVERALSEPMRRTA